MEMDGREEKVLIADSLLEQELSSSCLLARSEKSDSWPQISTEFRSVTKSLVSDTTSEVFMQLLISCEVFKTD